MSKTASDASTTTRRSEPEGPRQEPEPPRQPHGGRGDRDELVALVLEMDDPPPEEAGYGHGV